jgi:hypothetical protein
VAHTPEQRDKQRLCGAKKKNGEPCRAFAGQGTDHPGYGCCKFHLGATAKHTKHAFILEAQQKMVKLGGPIEIHALDALLAMLYISSGHVAWLREAIAGLEEDFGAEKGVALTSLYGEERDRVAKIAKACLEAGVAERQVRVAEQFGEALANVLHEIFWDPELDLDEEQRATLPAVLRRHLVSLSSENGSSPLRALTRGTDLGLRNGAP